MKKAEIQLIRNATLKIKYAGNTILVDPMLSPKNSFMSFVVPGQNLNPTLDLPISIQEITEDVDAILLTHSHPDHFDETAKNILNKDLPFFVQAADEKMLKEAAFTNVISIENTTIHDAITITRTIGKHGPDELLDTLGQVSGFVLQAEDHPTIYIIGDCIWDEDIERQIEQYNPDVIITNSGGAIFMGQTRILMDEEETIKVARKAQNAKVIATHIESLDHCKVTRVSLAQAAASAGVSIMIPTDGEHIVL